MCFVSDVVLSVVVCQGGRACAVVVVLCAPVWQRGLVCFVSDVVLSVVVCQGGRVFAAAVLLRVLAW